MTVASRAKQLEARGIGSVQQFHRFRWRGHPGDAATDRMVRQRKRSAHETIPSRHRDRCRSRGLQRVVGAAAGAGHRRRFGASNAWCTPTPVGDDRLGCSLIQIRRPFSPTTTAASFSADNAHASAGRRCRVKARRHTHQRTRLRSKGGTLRAAHLTDTRRTRRAGWRLRPR